MLRCCIFRSEVCTSFLPHRERAPSSELGPRCRKAEENLCSPQSDTKTTHDDRGDSPKSASSPHQSRGPEVLTRDSLGSQICAVRMKLLPVQRIETIPVR